MLWMRIKHMYNIFLRHARRTCCLVHRIQCCCPFPMMPKMVAAQSTPESEAIYYMYSVRCESRRVTYYDSLQKQIPTYLGRCISTLLGPGKATPGWKKSRTSGGGGNEFEVIPRSPRRV
jgi:hypothetical protein